MQPAIPQARYVRYPSYNIPNTNIIDVSINKLIEKKVQERRYAEQYRQSVQAGESIPVPMVLTDPFLNIQVKDYYRNKYERTIGSEIGGRVIGATEGGLVGAGLGASIGTIVGTIIGTIGSIFLPDAGALIPAGAKAGGAIGAKIGAATGATTGTVLSDYSTLYSTKDMFQNLWGRNQTIGRRALNTLYFVGQSSELASITPFIKSSLYKLTSGQDVSTTLKQAYGLDKEGRVDMDFSLIRESLGWDFGTIGNIIFDLSGEVFSDPTQLSNIIKAFVKGNAADDIAQSVLKQIDDVKIKSSNINRFKLNKVDSKKLAKIDKNIKANVLDSMLKSMGLPKGVMSDFTDPTVVKIIKNNITDTIKATPKNIKRFKNGLLNTLVDGNADEFYSYLVKTNFVNSDNPFNLFMKKIVEIDDPIVKGQLSNQIRNSITSVYDSIKTSATKNVAYNQFKLYSIIADSDDFLNKTLFKIASPEISAISVISKIQRNTAFFPKAFKSIFGKESYEKMGWFFRGNKFKYDYEPGASARKEEFDSFLKKNYKDYVENFDIGYKTDFTFKSFTDDIPEFKYKNFSSAEEIVQSLSKSKHQELVSKYKQIITAYEETVEALQKDLFNITDVNKWDDSFKKLQDFIEQNKQLYYITINKFNILTNPKQVDLIKTFYKIKPIVDNSLILNKELTKAQHDTFIKAISDIIDYILDSKNDISILEGFLANELKTSPKYIRDEFMDEIKNSFKNSFIAKDNEYIVAKNKIIPETKTIKESGIIEKSEADLIRERIVQIRNDFKYLWGDKVTNKNTFDSDVSLKIFQDVNFEKTDVNSSFSSYTDEIFAEEIKNLFDKMSDIDFELTNTESAIDYISKDISKRIKNYEQLKVQVEAFRELCNKCIIKSINDHFKIYNDTARTYRLLDRNFGKIIDFVSSKNKLSKGDISEVVSRISKIEKSLDNKKYLFGTQIKSFFDEFSKEVNFRLKENYNGKLVFSNSLKSKLITLMKLTEETSIEENFSKRLKNIKRIPEVPNIKNQELARELLRYKNFVGQKVEIVSQAFNIMKPNFHLDFLQYHLNNFKKSIGSLLNNNSTSTKNISNVYSNLTRLDAALINASYINPQIFKPFHYYLSEYFSEIKFGSFDSLFDSYKINNIVDQLNLTLNHLSSFQKTGFPFESDSFSLQNFKTVVTKTQSGIKFDIQFFSKSEDPDVKDVVKIINEMLKIFKEKEQFISDNVVLAKLKISRIFENCFERNETREIFLNKIKSKSPELSQYLENLYKKIVIETDTRFVPNNTKKELIQKNINETYKEFLSPHISTIYTKTSKTHWPSQRSTKLTNVNPVVIDSETFNKQYGWMNQLSFRNDDGKYYTIVLDKEYIENLAKNNSEISKKIKADPEVEQLYREQGGVNGMWDSILRKAKSNNNPNEIYIIVKSQKEMVEKFLESVDTSKILIAHNAKFDLDALAAAYLEKNIADISPAELQNTLKEVFDYSVIDTDRIQRLFRVADTNRSSNIKVAEASENSKVIWYNEKGDAIEIKGNPDAPNVIEYRIIEVAPGEFEQVVLYNRNYTHIARTDIEITYNNFKEAQKVISEKYKPSFKINRNNEIKTIDFDVFLSDFEDVQIIEKSIKSRILIEFINKDIPSNVDEILDNYLNSILKYNKLNNLHILEMFYENLRSLRNQLQNLDADSFYKVKRIVNIIRFDLDRANEIIDGDLSQIINNLDDDIISKLENFFDMVLFRESESALTEFGSLKKVGYQRINQSLVMSQFLNETVNNESFLKLVDVISGNVSKYEDGSFEKIFGNFINEKCNHPDKYFDDLRNLRQKFIEFKELIDYIYDTIDIIYLDKESVKLKDIVLSIFNNIGKWNDIEALEQINKYCVDNNLDICYKTKLSNIYSSLKSRANQISDKTLTEYFTELSKESRNVFLDVLRYSKSEPVSIKVQQDLGIEIDYSKTSEKPISEQNFIINEVINLFEDGLEDPRIVLHNARTINKDFLGQPLSEDAMTQQLTMPISKYLELGGNLKESGYNLEPDVNGKVFAPDGSELTDIVIRPADLPRLNSKTTIKYTYDYKKDRNLHYKVNDMISSFYIENTRVNTTIPIVSYTTSRVDQEFFAQSAKAANLSDRNHVNFIHSKKDSILEGLEKTDDVYSVYWQTLVDKSIDDEFLKSLGINPQEFRILMLNVSTLNKNSFSHLDGEKLKQFVIKSFIETIINNPARFNLDETSKLKGILSPAEKYAEVNSQSIKKFREFKSYFNESATYFDYMKSWFINTDGSVDINGFNAFLKNHSEYYLTAVIPDENGEYKLRRINANDLVNLENVLNDNNSIFALISSDVFETISSKMNKIVMDGTAGILRQQVLSRMKRFSLANISFAVQNAVSATMNTMLSLPGKIASAPYVISNFIKSFKDYQKYNKAIDLFWQSKVTKDFIRNTTYAMNNKWLKLLDDEKFIKALKSASADDVNSKQLLKFLESLKPEDIDMLKEVHELSHTTAAFGQINEFIKDKERGDILEQDALEASKKLKDYGLSEDQINNFRKKEWDAFLKNKTPSETKTINKLRYTYNRNKYQTWNIKDIKAEYKELYKQKMSNPIMFNNRDEKNLQLLKSLIDGHKNKAVDSVLGLNIINRWLNFNNQLETSFRLAGLRMYLNDGMTIDQATAEVIKRQFAYNNKALAEQYLEFAIPFASYPLRMLELTNTIAEDADAVRWLFLLDKYIWKDENSERSDYLTTRRARGDVPIGDKLANLGYNPLLEGMVNITNPLYTLNNKINPIAKPIIDKATGSEYVRWSQLPGVSIFNNIGNVIRERNILANVTNDYYKYSNFTKYNITPLNYYGRNYRYRVDNRIKGSLYNKLYTSTGQSRISLNMQELNSYNLKYRINSIMKYSGPTRSRTSL